MTAPARSRSSFWCPGIARPQGSKNRGRNGHMYEASKHLPAWRESVSLAAIAAGLKPLPMPTPVYVGLTVYVAKPKSKAALAKIGPYPVQTPDLDKVQRGIGDALQGIAYDKDSQICAWHVERVWEQEEGPGVFVVVKSLWVKL